MVFVDFYISVLSLFDFCCCFLFGSLGCFDCNCLVLFGFGLFVVFTCFLLVLFVFGVRFTL